MRGIAKYFAICVVFVLLLGSAILLLRRDSHQSAPGLASSPAEPISSVSSTAVISEQEILRGTGFPNTNGVTQDPSAQIELPTKNDMSAGNQSTKEEEPIDTAGWGQKALELVSLPEPFVPRVLSVSQMPGSDLKIPFLGDQLGGKNLISVEMHAGAILFTNNRVSYTNRLLNSIRCVFLEDTGQMLEVVIAREAIGVLPGEMSTKEAEERYKWTGERYHGVPQVEPDATCCEILNRLVGVSPAAVWESKKIVVRYLVTSREGSLQKEPRWIVNCYGFPPMPAKGISDATDGERSHLRFVFSSDGVFIGGDNQP